MRSSLTPRSGRRSPAPPGPGARLAAWLCLLLVMVASTAQAVHVHGAGLPNRHASLTKMEASSLAGDESGCPLCVAMHSALPTAVDHTHAPVALLAAEGSFAPLDAAAEPEHFARFSRPPPSA